MVLIGAKLVKPLLKVGLVAGAAGLAYFTIVKPTQDALAAPAKALEDAGEFIAKGFEDFTGSVGVAFEGDASDPGNALEEAGATFQRLFGGLTLRESAASRGDLAALQSIREDVNRRATVVSIRREPGAPPPRRGAADLSKIFSNSGIDQRIINVTSNNKNNFGGFGSSVGQEAALRDAIAESASQYPDWFF